LPGRPEVRFSFLYGELTGAVVQLSSETLEDLDEKAT